MSENRERKGRKILAILQDYCSTALSEKKCLDIGCGNGGILQTLAPYFSQVIGIEINEQLIKEALKSNTHSNTAFILGNGSQLPFDDESFAIIICAQVYEHIEAQEELMNQIYSKLGPSGICFFSGPNKLAVWEDHYSLPFLSWLPKPIANIYLRILNRGSKYDINALSYWKIKKLCSAFQIIDYTPNLIREPEKYFLTTELKKVTWIRYMPYWLLKMLSPVFPNYNWILLKKL